MPTLSDRVNGRARPDSHRRPAHWLIRQPRVGGSRRFGLQRELLHHIIPTEHALPLTTAHHDGVETRCPTSAEAPTTTLLRSFPPIIPLHRHQSLRSQKTKYPTGQR